MNIAEVKVQWSFPLIGLTEARPISENTQTVSRSSSPHVETPNSQQIIEEKSNDGFGTMLEW